MAARILRPGELPAVLPAGLRTLVSSCSAESALLAGEIAASGGALGASDFSGIFVAGLNKASWDAGPQSRVTSFFLTPELRRQPERTRYLPLCYQDILRHYRQEPPQAALFMCAPPDDEGNCSFGTEVAFGAALWPDIPIRIAHINPAMPRTPGERGIPYAALTAVFEGHQPLLTMASGAADETSRTIAELVAGLVPDGATIQTGLGKLPDAVLAALGWHSQLRIHSGLIGDGALALLRSGAMAPGRSAVVGVAIGSEALYQGLDNPHLEFRSVTTTHDPATLADIERLVTINSGLAVDLFGQVYAEASARGYMSGPGGASDYARGARASKGGLRIIALPAAAGAISRIVAPGAGEGPVSLSRFDVDCVVTENGIAHLRLKDYSQRAAALIAIAAPAHRDALAQTWRGIASQF